MLGEFRHGRGSTQTLRQGRDGLPDREVVVLHSARGPHRPGAVAEVPPDLAHDRGHREGEEVSVAVGIEPFQRTEQADGGDLLEVVHRLAPSRVTARDAPGHRQVDHHQTIAQARATGIGGVHPSVFRKQRRSPRVLHVVLGACHCSSFPWTGSRLRHAAGPAQPGEAATAVVEKAISW